MSIWRAGGRKKQGNSLVGQQVDVVIDGYSHDGQGVGRYKGKPIFIADALKNESVTARIEQANNKRLTAKLIDVEQESDARIEPSCQYFGRCGGCVWQNLSYEAQLEAKEQRFMRQLAQLNAQTVLDASEQNSPYKYRRRARFAVSWRDGLPKMGFRERNAKKIVSIDACPVLTNELEELISPLNDWLAQLKGGVSEVLVTLLDQVRVGIGVNSDVSSAQRALLKESAEQVGWIYHDYDDARDANTVTAYDFVQANAFANGVMQSTLTNWLSDLEEGTQIVDLFSGLGNFTNYLAGYYRLKGSPVMGYELDMGMVTRAKRMAVANAEYACADLFEGALPKAVFDANVLVLDPPRAGAHHIAQQIAEHADQLPNLSQIVYISCDPATQVRDAKILMQAGYQISRAKVVDMFPQTPHIETMMLLTKES